MRISNGRLFSVAAVSVLGMSVVLLGDACAGSPNVPDPCKGFTFISTKADLDMVRNNLSGKFCLDNDINLASVANFDPIGNEQSPFTGQFNGQGHVIRNLKINTNGLNVGLFSAVTGSVTNLGVVNAKVIVTSDSNFWRTAGILAGNIASKGSIGGSYATGSVSCTTSKCLVGGLVGNANSPNLIYNSWSSAAVTGGDTTSAGGLVGENGGKISGSYATGDVTCGNACLTGGLVGESYTNSSPGSATATVMTSFATGAVSSGANSNIGGLIGHHYRGNLNESYASGPVSGGATSSIGGLVGYNQGSVSQSYAVGPSSTMSPNFIGGLVGQQTNPGTVTTSYWDTDTTKQMTSPGGVAKTTPGLRSTLPAGFVVPPWGITKKRSYPYLMIGSYYAALATTVAKSKVYVFLPIDQLERGEYASAPAHADAASVATVYTMIGRAIGLTDDIALLKNEKIDKYYWDDATQTTTWTGPVTTHATLGTTQTLAAATPIDTTNIIGMLDTRQPVIISGPSGGVTHFMLATLYTTDTGGNVTALIANDPWTGKQVWIDPTTKQVVSPSNFPLAGWSVKHYRSVTLN